MATIFCTVGVPCTCSKTIGSGWPAATSAPSSRRTRASTVRSDDRGAEPNVITNCLAERFSSRTRVNPFCRVTETRIGSASDGAAKCGA